MTRALALLAVAALASSACVTPKPHIELPRAPTRDAPYEERARYYKSYVLDSREADHLFLHGGTRVYWPEDLLPAIDDAAPTAAAIREHVEAREKAWRYAWVGQTGAGLMGVGLLSLVGMLVPLVLPLDDATQTQAVLVLAGTSIGALGVGLGVGLVHVALVNEDEVRAAEAADRAVRTYPQALSDRLAVGVDADGRIVDQVLPAVSAPLPPRAPQGSP